MSKEIMYRFTVGCWFVLGFTMGALSMRVYDMFDYLDRQKDTVYICHKNIAYQAMGENDGVVYVKTNLQCLGE